MCTVGDVDDKLCQKPKLKDAYNATKSVAARWNDLGRSLGISLDKRKELRRDGALSNDDRLEEILNTWLQTQGTTATWSSLIDALKENGLNDIVTDIKQKL